LFVIERQTIIATQRNDSRISRTPSLREDMTQRILFIAAAFMAWLAAAPALAQEPRSSPNRASQISQEAALVEMQSIRRQIGGVLEGTSLQVGPTAATPNDEFTNLLREASANVASDWAPIEVQDLGSPFLVDPAPAPPVSEGLVPSLRDAARQLEWRAEMFEVGRDYRRADRLRALARRLRREARELDAELSGTQSEVEFVKQPKAARR
jgi:hypothetical protein